jgi:LmbE family N-acetylglucosaminyl deacetylase
MIAFDLRGARRFVCLGAHPDDIEIGCGATLLTLAERGDAFVRGLVLTGEGARADEARESLPRFFSGASVQVGGLPDGRLPAHWSAVKDQLEQFAGIEPADVVLAPRVDDAHQDHRLIGTLARTVWRDALLLHYEIPKWDGDLATPSHYVPLSKATARRKVDLLHRSFPSQRARDWWDDELFLGLLRLRGVEARAPYAEGFFVAKAVVDLG